MSNNINHPFNLSTFDMNAPISVNIEFNYEKHRDMADREKLAAMAGEMWDAGAYLLMAHTDGSKRPKGNWRDGRHRREEIVAWVEMGHHIGIVKPHDSLSLTCVDIDNGIEWIPRAVKYTGCHPLVIHESSRTKEGKCHAWYKAASPTQAYKWEGGDIRCTSMHFVILYNIHAVYDAWKMATNTETPVKLANIDALPMLKFGKADTPDDVGNDTLELEPDSDGVILQADIQVADGTPVSTNRHDTLTARVGRAVNQCNTRSEFNARFKLMVDAHKEAIRAEGDKVRIASLKSELAGAKAFAEGLWAKKKLMKKHRASVLAIIKSTKDISTAKRLTGKVIEEYTAECTENGLPTIDKCKDEVVSYFHHEWGKREEKRTRKEMVKQASQQLTEKSNAKAATTFENTGTGQFIVDSLFGTIQSWQEAIDSIGVKMRYNTFVEQGEVWIPAQIAGEKQGGRWVEIDDNNNSTIIATIEKHCLARIDPDDDEKLRAVYLGKNKQKEARNDIFNRNSFCPMSNYFSSLPKWCGVPIIHESMERGGMKIDAGEFTGAVQSFVWLFVVRNCLFPGSSVRECIVLHGPPKCGKSKFVELALPPHLKRYYNGGFQIDGSMKQKLERSLGKALMECGEFGGGGMKDWNAVKQWLTLSDVNGERMAYKEFVKRHRLTATTVFTTNKQELPPTDDAVLTRFIWANVVSPADRIVSADGTIKEIVWSHFDDLYDPNHPELGTWREQYFAEALHRVKEAVVRTDRIEEGVKVSDFSCNPSWLPVNPKVDLIQHNKDAGATYNTNQSLLVDDILQAIELLDSEWEICVEDGDVFYPNMEIKAAIHALREGKDFESWWKISDNMRNSYSEREAELVRKVANDREFSNSMSMAAERLCLKCAPKSAKYGVKGEKKVVRGYYFTKPKPQNRRYTEDG